MKSLIAALLSLAGTLSLAAQIPNYQPGYYIISSGDTLSAQLSQEGSFYLSRNIRKKNADGSVETLTAGSLRGFGWPDQGLHYEQISHTYTTEAGEKIATPRQALRLVDGPNRLYRLEQQPEEYFQALSDVKNHVYYFRNEGGETFKLERIEEQSTESRFRVLEKYRGALRYLMADWPEADRRIERLTFRDENLASLLEDYNNFLFPDNKSTRIKKGKKLNHQVSLLGVLPRPESSYRIQSGFSLGYGVFLSNPRSSNSLRIGIGIEYLHKDFAGAEVAPGVTAGKGYESMIRVPLNLDFVLIAEKKVKPMINFYAGLGIVRSVGSAYGNGSSDVIVSSAANRLYNYEVSDVAMFVGAGPRVQIGRVEIMARIETSWYGGFENDTVSNQISGRGTVLAGVSYRISK